MNFSPEVRGNHRAGIKKSYFFCFYARLIVPLTPSKIITLENAQIKFGILLTYS